MKGDKSHRDNSKPAKDEKKEKKKKDKTLIGNKRSFNDVVQELPKAAKTTLKDKKP